MEIQEIAACGLAAAVEASLPPLAAGQADAGPLCIAAIIGFAGDQIRGTLALAVDDMALTRIREHAGAKDTQSEDALGEAANLVAGHLKRTFSGYGQVLTITPPIVVRGVTIQVCSSGQSNRAEHVVQSSGGHMVTWFDYNADENVELTATDGGETITEGESLFF